MKVFGIVGWKNSGKTTLTEKVVASMVSKGYSVSSIKHAHHNFVVDQEGKDSDRHKKAGASQVIVTSKNQWALISSQRYSEKEVLSKMLKKLDPVDFVIIEGFKTYWHPKIETYLSGNSNEPLIATSKNKSKFSSKNTSIISSGFDITDNGNIIYFKGQTVLKIK